jgi:hypothetical protein
MVPGTAIPGNYLYNAYIRDHNTWQVITQDSFPFSKLPGVDVTNHNLGWCLLGWNDNEFLATTHPEFILYPAYPNPFNNKTILTYSIPINSEVSLIVYDICGKEVIMIYQGYQSVGTHCVEIDGRNLSSGIYFVRLNADDFSQTQKLLLIK